MLVSVVVGGWGRTWSDNQKAVQRKQGEGKVRESAMGGADFSIQARVLTMGGTIGTQCKTIEVETPR